MLSSVLLQVLTVALESNLESVPLLVGGTIWGRGVQGVRIGRSPLKVLIPVGALVNFFQVYFSYKTYIFIK